MTTPILLAGVDSLSVRHERGEVREGSFQMKTASSPRPSPPSFLWRRGSKPFAFTEEFCLTPWKGETVISDLPNVSR